MAWPVTGTANASVLLTGDVSTSRWGTDSLLTAATTLIITKASQRLKKTDQEYKNGNGLQSGRSQLIDGVIWDVTFRDRTDVVPPQINTMWSIVDMAGHLGTIGTAYLARCIDPNYEAAMGAPGERTAVFERIKLIEG